MKRTVAPKLRCYLQLDFVIATCHVVMLYCPEHTNRVILMFNSEHLN